MENIFIFTAGNPEARSHLADSITNPIDSNLVLSQSEKRFTSQLQAIYEKEKGFYAWGAEPGPLNKTTWNNMEINDWVLCVYANKYNYVCRVLLKFRNEKLAESIWGRSQKTNNTWEYMYFLTKPKSTNVHVSDISNEFLNSGYRGFARIGNSRLNNIINKFGSVESFIEENITNEVPRRDIIGVPPITGEYLPDKEEFEFACRILSRTKKEISIDDILDLMESVALKTGNNLQQNWREITVKKITNEWSK